MQQVMTSTTKVLVDDKQGGNLLYLPLDKLMQLTSANPTKVDIQSVTPSAPTTTTSDDLFRSRDAFRSREREARP